MKNKELLKVYKKTFGELIFCKFCGMIHSYKKAVYLGFKYKEIKCKCGRTIYC